ncbi:nucleotidyltransferase domain-containing protein [Sphingobium sp.]|uniref:nucleotidyltransferase family protein n=1 Tax=Sphingobium sp. TaxID=1912891 RepID=UPI00262FEF6D|nr:nucleotidyltransferase domain-containing protein [Sphingobium sp.]
MDRNIAISRLKACEAELRAMGVVSLSLFGSTARGDQRSDSDVDVAARLTEDGRIGLFEVAAISEAVREALGAAVDFVTEPARMARLQSHIDRDRVRVF